MNFSFSMGARPSNTPGIEAFFRKVGRNGVPIIYLQDSNLYRVPILLQLEQPFRPERKPRFRRMSLGLHAARLHFATMRFAFFLG